MNTDVLTRVRYFDKQFLRATDFSDEQAYHLAIHRRHAITHHTPGILIGLDLQAEDGVAFVAPGIAIDGYGRELVLSKSPILPERFRQLDATQLEVWLFYQRELNGSSAGNDCGPLENNRLTESARIELSAKGAIQPRVGNPNLETPDDPSLTWPVFLGLVTYDAAATDPKDKFTFSLDGRNYAGAVAGTIHHPKEDVKVTLDGEDAIFTVTVGKADPRLEIRADQTNMVRGDTTVEGNLRLNGGALQFPSPTQEDANPPAPAIYRFSGDSTDQLRIDLGDLSADDKQFVIGHTKNGKFVPAITLAFEKEAGQITPKVTIHGDLKLEGLIYSPDTKYRVLSAEVLTALQAMFQTGLAAGGSR
jgi:hypothetical protein